MIWCEDCGARSDDGGYYWRHSALSMNRNLGEMYMLFVSEVCEAFEEHRNNHDLNYVYYIDDYGFEKPYDLDDPAYMMNGTPAKPEGQLIECVDTLIRMYDACGHYWSAELVEKAMECKFTYNQTRGHRHGNKAA